MLSFKDYIFSCVPLKVKHKVVDLGKPKEIVKRKPQKISEDTFLPQFSVTKLDVKVGFNRKLFRRFEIQRQIDLHGLTVDEAFSTLAEFFLKCQQDGIKTVLVITGGHALKSSPIRTSFKRWVRDNFSEFL